MRQLFVLDPLSQIRPEKDSTAALMQAAQRARDDIWACTPSDLIARGDEPMADGSESNGTKLAQGVGVRVQEALFQSFDYLSGE